MLRIVVAKPGLDGHDRGAKVVARALRDAGHEVIYTGLHQTPEQIVETAIQEDADLVGLSVLSGAHMTLFRRIVELLEERDASDIVLFGGGIIPADDVGPLQEIGVARLFTPGATTRETSMARSRRAMREASSGNTIRSVPTFVRSWSPRTMPTMPTHTPAPRKTCPRVVICHRGAGTRVRCTISATISSAERRARCASLLSSNRCARTTGAIACTSSGSTWSRPAIAA